MPIGNDIPVLWTGNCGSSRDASSRSQTPNLATTNPRLMIAMLVRTQARNVRSTARCSVHLRWSGRGVFIGRTPLFSNCDNCSPQAGIHARMLGHLLLEGVDG